MSIDALAIYLPVGKTVLKRGSAIVGVPAAGSILAYFEGNVHGARDLATFEERVNCAAGRLTEHYPTIAKASFAAHEIVQVGTARILAAYRQWVIGELSDPAALEAWLAPEPLPSINGGPDLRARLAGKVFRKLSAIQLAALHRDAAVTGQSLVDLIVDRHVLA